MVYPTDKIYEIVEDFRPTCGMQNTSNPNQFYLRINDGSFIHSETDSLIGGSGIALECIGGVVLNTLLISALIRRSKIRNEYLTPFVVSMSLADFSYSAFSLPVYYIRFFNKKWPNINCSIYAFISYSLWSCSAWNLLGVAMIRYIVVYNNKITNSKWFSLMCKMIPFMAWILSFLSFTPSFLGIYGQFGAQCIVECCRLVSVNSNGDQLRFQPERHISYMILIMGIIMLSLNALTYAKVIVSSRKIAKQMKDVRKNLAKDILEKERKVGMMMVIITMAFFLGFLTLPISRVIDPNFFFNHPRTQITLWLFAGSIGIIDPLVYILFQEHYREEIRKLFLC